MVYVDMWCLFVCLVLFWLEWFGFWLLWFCWLVLLYFGLGVCWMLWKIGVRCCFVSWRSMFCWCGFNGWWLFSVILLWVWVYWEMLVLCWVRWIWIFWFCLLVGSCFWMVGSFVWLMVGVLCCLIVLCVLVFLVLICGYCLGCWWGWGFLLSRCRLWLFNGLVIFILVLFYDWVVLCKLVIGFFWVRYGVVCCVWWWKFFGWRFGVFGKCICLMLVGVIWLWWMRWCWILILWMFEFCFLFGDYWRMLLVDCCKFVGSVCLFGCWICMMFLGGMWGWFLRMVGCVWLVWFCWFGFIC